MGKNYLNIIFFIVFTALILIFQGILYNKTIKMSSLNENLYKIQNKSKDLFNNLEVEGKYRKIKNTELFNDILIFKEKQDKRYPFIYNRDLIYSKSGKKFLKENSSLDKKIYDSCDNTEKLLNHKKKYILAYKNHETEKCYVFVSASLNKLLRKGTAPIWYLLFGVILSILTIFVFIPENKKKKIILISITFFHEIFFYLHSLIIEENNKIKQIKNITDKNLTEILALTIIATIIFSFFYLSKLNERLINTLVKYKTPYFYILPGGIGILLLSFAPLFSGIILSFFRVKYGKYEFVFLENYYEILIGGLKDISNPEGFYYTFFITVIWTAVNIFFHLLIGMSIALILNNKRLKFKKIYSVIFIIPWAIPNYITALIWKSMFHKQFGSINDFLVLLGFERISWFTGTFTAFTANLLTNIWLGFPFMMVMTLGALQSIPAHLYDAATMDGATKWQQFKHITLPMLKPALLPSVILGIIWTFNMFNVIYLVSGGEPNGSTDILITEAYRWAFERNGRYGYSAAYATIIFIVLFLYNQITGKIQKGATNE